MNSLALALERETWNVSNPMKSIILSFRPIRIVELSDRSTAEDQTTILLLDPPLTYDSLESNQLMEQKLFLLSFPLSFSKEEQLFITQHIHFSISSDPIKIRK